MLGRGFNGFYHNLPKSEGNIVITVVVDKITKYAHFCALSQPFKVSTIATAFMETIQSYTETQRLL